MNGDCPKAMICLNLKQIAPVYAHESRRASCLFGEVFGTSAHRCAVRYHI